MRLATLKSNSADGQLVAVSRDGSRYLAIGDETPNLLAAMERWDGTEAVLAQLGDRLDQG